MVVFPSGTTPGRPPAKVHTDSGRKTPPNPHLTADVSPDIPEEGRPKGPWRINIKREGIFKGKQLLPKLERMGLIASEESCVGSGTDERGRDGYSKMFVSQQSFWQIDPRIFLFTLSPTQHSPFPGASPYPSRPGSPNREATPLASPRLPPDGTPGEPSHNGLWSQPHSPGPFASGSHLPTYYPPPPPQYTFTKNTRHPIRPKPPAQGKPRSISLVSNRLYVGEVPNVPRTHVSRIGGHAELSSSQLWHLLCSITITRQHQHPSMRYGPSP